MFASVRTGASSLALTIVMTLGLAPAAWGQTQSSTNVTGGGSSLQETISHGKWHQSAVEQMSTVVAKYLPLVTEIAARHNDFPVDRVMAIILVESMGNENARNGGLVQVTRPILKKFGGGCNSRKAACSLEAGIAYLDSVRQQVGDLNLTTVAYNHGLAGALRLPDISQTAYLNKVLSVLPAVQMALNQLQQPAVPEMVEASYMAPNNDSSSVPQ